MMQTGCRNPVVSEQNGNKRKNKTSNNSTKRCRILKQWLLWFLLSHDFIWAKHLINVWGVLGLTNMFGQAFPHYLGVNNKCDEQFFHRCKSPLRIKTPHIFSQHQTSRDYFLTAFNFISPQQLFVLPTSLGGNLNNASSTFNL